MYGESHRSAGAAAPERSPDEQVVLVAADGRVTGSAARAVVRRDNMRHAATAVLLRDGGRRIYVHRRTDAKDWAPGHWDAAAGGMLQEGEDPAESAARELAEELGVIGATLIALGTHLYEDDATRCFEHAFEATWDGPVVHQPTEVAEGGWLTLAELRTLLADPGRPFVPDTRQLLARLAAAGVHDYAVLG
jgi:8-oxo-dGTP pyrophosphatase MutT (NUDIX family)